MLSHLSSTELIYFRNQTIEKFPVVGNKNYRPIKITNRLFQHIFGTHIQMVSRLIENKQIDRFEQ